jgi:SAM-dependent methyltransferase
MEHDKPFANPAFTWDTRFSNDGYWFGTEPNGFLASLAPMFTAGARALAVADGEGRNSVWLAQRGLEVDAFDISATGVAKAQELARQAGVTVNYQVADCDSWNWQPENYDIVAAIFIQFAAPEDRRRLFANMVAALKPGGHLVLQGYTPKQLDYGTGGPGILEHLYTEELLRAELPGLEFEQVRVYEEVLAEGKGHSGPSALIGVVARK